MSSVQMNAQKTQGFLLYFFDATQRNLQKINPMVVPSLIHTQIGYEESGWNILLNETQPIPTR